MSTPDSDSLDTGTGLEIAIVGMAGRFPGAADPDAFWRNLRDGVQSRTAFSDADLLARGVPQQALDDPGYVRAGIVLDDVAEFDAGFFGYTPREAEQLDPQHRLFLECAWQALEQAGGVGRARNDSVGVYGGSGAGLYLLRHLLPATGLGADSGIADLLGLLNGNSPGSLCARVAYKLDLRGPAVTLQTECSTSLAAVHYACHALWAQDCDMALAGGVWINLMQEQGYQFQEGAILSPDGRCRAFDQDARGTVIGSGAGVVALKRLADALRDGDTVHAVIKGSAVNNDGADKVGFTAPSVAGQAAVIRAALALADVAPASVGYVEAHGTGTTLGDPVEIAALAEAFGADCPPGSCALGSVKTNIGHLDAAAGIAGLIKAALALRHQQLPPSLNFQSPNPRIDFGATPFYVNTSLRPWPRGATPRRAGVSSFGMGGTNVHVVLEEAPVPDVSGAPDDRWQVLPVSAQTPAALNDARTRLARHLEQSPGAPLGDVAWTLQAGRREFAHRDAVVARDAAQAARLLAEPMRQPAAAVRAAPPVAWLFPGSGAQYGGMAAALYRDDEGFRQTLDHCCARLRALTGHDLLPLVLAEGAASETADTALFEVALAQPALFAVEYAMAQWWLRRGVRPDIMLGHSLGEYAAACVAGVFELDDALYVVAERARLLQSLPPGAMTAVALPADALAPVLRETGCDLAAVNGEEVSVLSGPLPAIEAAEAWLAREGHVPRRLHVALASHSAMTEAVTGPLERVVASVPRRAPSIPFVSNLTGARITDEMATDPAYWARHLRGTVRYAQGLDTLYAEPGRVLLEVGPGETLIALARQHPGAGTARALMASLAHPRQRDENGARIAQAVAALWQAGVPVDWRACRANGGRMVPLPTYPFQRKRHWVDATTAASRQAQAGPTYCMTWRRAAAPSRVKTTRGEGPGVAWSGVDASGVDTSGAQNRSLDTSATGCVLWVGPAPDGCIEGLGTRGYTVRHVADTAALPAALARARAEPGGLAQVVWQAPGAGADDLAGIDGLLAVLHALDPSTPPQAASPLGLTVLTRGALDVSGDEPIDPAAAALNGLLKVAQQEYPGLACRLLDLGGAATPAAVLCAELAAWPSGDPATPHPSTVAYRGRQRWLRDVAPLALPPSAPRLRRAGVVLITGGLGGVGLALAGHLAAQWQTRLALLGRNATAQARAPAMQQRLQALEAAGGQVLVCDADVGDPASLQAALALTRARYGALHGVVHAAGADATGMLADWDGAAMAGVLAPKIAGTRALLDALAGQPLDFVLLCSSLASVAGGLGMGAYAAANAYLDGAAAQATRHCDYPVLSVNWDAWRGLGMAAGMEMPDGVGLEGPAGARLFERIVDAAPCAQVLVCTTDLHARLRASGQDLLDGVDEAEAGAATAQTRHPRPSLPTPYAAPRDAAEREVAAVWQERLGLDGIGRDDSFFELGGDSLVAIQVLSRLKKQWGVDVHPSAFFREPTIAALAAQAARARQGGAAARAPVELAPLQHGDVLPLSPMQRRLWLVQRLADPAQDSALSAYNISARLDIEGRVEPDLVARAIGTIIERHQALRTVYDEDEDGNPLARAVAAPTLNLPVHDLRDATAADRQAREAALFDTLRGTPLPLDAAPLLRACMLRLAPTRSRLLVAVHHIAFDGWSISVFARELSGIYQALAQERPLTLAPPAVQYADYAAWEARRHTPQALQASRAFWRDYLAGAPAVSSPPSERPRPAVASHRGGCVPLQLPPELADGLRRVARGSGTSLFNVLIAAFFLVMHRAADARDLVVGTDVAGRDHPWLEHSIGFFVNVVPLRSRLDDAPPSFLPWLAHTAGQVSAAMDHRHVPFDEIVDMAGAPRSRGHNPLLQMLFVLQNTPAARFELGEASVQILPQGENDAKFDLAVFVTEQPAGLACEWVYASDLYSEATAREYAAAWHGLLTRIADTPDLDIAPFVSRNKEKVGMRTALANSKANKLARLAAGAAQRPDSAAQVATRPFDEGRLLPLVIEPAQPGLDAVAWARANAGQIEQWVARHGGLLFRDFGLKTPQQFESFAEAIEPQLFGSYGDLPKKEGGRNTYRSTPYPEKQMILYHNESAHLERWPRKQWFFCELPSPSGGATPIVDCREMLTRLPQHVVERFEQHGLLYVRTFTPRLDVDWRDFYKTSDRAQVESRLAAAGTQWRWLDADTLQTRTQCPAIIRHPVTGERSFFNQVQLHHSACLEEDVREDLLSLVGAERMPRQVYYGDGSVIPDDVMRIVGEAYEACAVRFQWRQGDIVMLDNMLAAHARDPYQGPRKIVVAMGEMVDRSSLDLAEQAQ
ncbi:polyketide synthase [Bordetella ansorpii]|uniref:Polyketide synthase n=1 Tax=Bordetella ansorpii TaxID=288768 RepID=A0A157MFU1_9BORD|nr:type I polyketide synthase [Bordetella ansorpii]SAI07982.1 polyketide synthase [Bordetella ansorpii]